MHFTRLLVVSASFLPFVPSAFGTTLPVRADVVKRATRTQPLLKAFPGQDPLPSLQSVSSANATNGTFLPLDNIQGDILVGMKKQKENFVFFQINNAAAFKTALKTYVPGTITSAATLIAQATAQPLAFVNLAFSQSGLSALGITDNLGDALFSAGQFADAPTLGDDTTTWESAFKGTGIHGVFLIGSDQDSFITTFQNNITTQFGSSLTVLDTIQAAARPGDQAGHEHFGYLDGISNPAVSGFQDSPLPGQTVVDAGIILTGRTGDSGVRPSWALDGSFMAFRKLHQLVPEFRKWTLDNAIQNTAGNLTVQEGADFLGARMFGRWKSGAPIDLTPQVDDPALGADPQRNNNFDFSHPGSSLSTDESFCPFAAHIRKTNPRADLGDTNTVNHAIRSSTPYGPEVTDAESSSNTTTVDRGLAFVEYQSSIGNGFRFQQVNWVNNPGFPFGKTPTPGIDTVIGQATPRTANGLDPNDVTKSLTPPQFIIANGGEYFFVPSISALTTVIAA